MLSFCGKDKYRISLRIGLHIKSDKTKINAYRKNYLRLLVKHCMFYFSNKERGHMKDILSILGFIAQLNYGYSK